MHILALADDMTGALEVGAKFSAAGVDSLVSARPIPAGSAPVLVLDTESRHGSAEAAGQQIKRFVLDSGAARPSLVYKKTDSTLRGNIAAELRALADLFPQWRIGYAPAYPAMGRTVKNGVLFVNGVEVAKTAFANDILNPIHESSVSAMLGPELPCTVFDGTSEADLISAARAILADARMRIAAGPAGLAEAIAQEIGGLHRDRPLPSVRSCLVINGSLHENAAGQMRLAELKGCISGDPGAAWRMLRRSHGDRAIPAEVAKENGKYVSGSDPVERPGWCARDLGEIPPSR